MNNATLSVVEHKLMPITAAVSTPTVQVTAQYLTGQFEEFTVSSAISGHSMRDILAATVRCSLPAEIKDLELACSGLIQSTRKLDATGAQISGKDGDGERTGAARKFASWVKSVYGAVRFAGMSEKEFDGFASADSLYAASVKYRDAAGNIDWKGVDGTTRDATKAKKATKAAVQEAAEDSGIDTADILTMPPEDLAKLQAAAKVKLAESAAKAKLAAMEKAAGKLVKTLAKEYGIDDAETVLKRALEMLALGQIPA